MGFLGIGSDEDDGPTFSEQWTTTPDEGVQQWEYATIDLREQASGFRGIINEATGDGTGPSNESLNKLGKDGWELVETVEGSADDMSIGHATEGSKTNILIFKRPVEYERSSLPENETNTE